MQAVGSKSLLELVTAHLKQYPSVTERKIGFTAFVIQGLVRNSLRRLLRIQPEITIRYYQAARVTISLTWVFVWEASVFKWNRWERYITHARAPQAPMSLPLLLCAPAHPMVHKPSSAQPRPLHPWEPFAAGSSASESLCRAVSAHSHLAGMAVPCCLHCLMDSPVNPDLPHHCVFVWRSALSETCPCDLPCPAPPAWCWGRTLPPLCWGHLGHHLTSPPWVSPLLLPNGTAGNKWCFFKNIYWQMPRYSLENSAISVLHCTQFTESPRFSCVFQDKHTTQYYDFLFLLAEWQLQDQEVWFLCLRVLLAGPWKERKKSKL